MENLEFQKKITGIAYNALASYGFALAGSGAIREYGIIDRPTNDVDLFTNVFDEDVFNKAKTDLAKAIIDNDLQLTEKVSTNSFYQICVSNGTNTTELDLGMDYRENAPTSFPDYLVLNISDAVANKFSALFSRTAPRDFLDADAIRQSKKYSDSELIKMLENIDEGFDKTIFANQLKSAQVLNFEELQEYGISNEEWHKIKERLVAWGMQLENEAREEQNNSIFRSNRPSCDNSAASNIAGDDDRPLAQTQGNTIHR